MVSHYDYTVDDVFDKKKVVKAVKPDWSGESSRVDMDGDFTKLPSTTDVNNSSASKRKSDQPIQSSAAKKLAKIDTKGMKSMASFFGATAKKK